MDSHQVKLRAILVCVDYADILQRTLPYNRHHFDEVCIVTTPGDSDTLTVANVCKCQTFQTDIFYKDEAQFNKWAALEEALNFFGRYGWLCIMDADVFWPKEAHFPILKPGNLYAPYRRMMRSISDPIPPEDEWDQFKRHRNTREFAGYSQIFHADDPRLGPPPWHEINWKHAGGADSFFQRKWPRENKIRPPFEVLHIGPACKNWCGRVSEYADGTMPTAGQSRFKTLMSYMRSRKGKRGDYSRERISGS